MLNLKENLNFFVKELQFPLIACSLFFTKLSCLLINLIKFYELILVQIFLELSFNLI